MKSGSTSCAATLVMLVVAAVLVRFLIPGLWKAMIAVSAGIVSLFLLLVVLGVVLVGFFTYKNLKRNRLKDEEKKIEKVVRVQQLYKSIQASLDRNTLANQVLSEEFLQAELLMGVKLPETKTDLIRLREVTSSKNQKAVEDQARDYRRQLREARDPSVKQVIEENLKMVDEKRERLSVANREIQEKEAQLDLLYHSLVKVDEDLKMGKTVQQLLPSEIYARFGLPAPSTEKSEPLPPMPQKSSLTE